MDTEDDEDFSFFTRNGTHSSYTQSCSVLLPPTRFLIHCSLNLGFMMIPLRAFRALSTSTLASGLARHPIVVGADNNR